MDTILIINIDDISVLRGKVQDIEEMLTTYLRLQSQNSRSIERGLILVISIDFKHR